MYRGWFERGSTSRICTAPVSVGRWDGDLVLITQARCHNGGNQAEEGYQVSVDLYSDY